MNISSLEFPEMRKNPSFNSEAFFFSRRYNVSHFEYYIVVLNKCSVQLSQRLQHAHNYCIGFVFSTRYQDHVTKYFSRLS